MKTTSIKTSELIGHSLNWAVAKADQPIYSDNALILSVQSGYAPSSNWIQGGLLIEREKITVGCSDDTCVIWDAYKREFLFEKDGLDAYSTGPNPLVAAMRCYVTSKLGEYVKIPNELIGT